jgi:hypothetical protein
VRPAKYPHFIEVPVLVYKHIAAGERLQAKDETWRVQKKIPICRADLEQAEKVYALSQGKDKHVADALRALAGPFKI